VEATVRQVKHPFPASKLPVRGEFRISCMVIGSAMMTNVRRIQRYLEARIQKENEQDGAQEQTSISLFAFLNAIFRRFAVSITINQVGFGYH
jgi:hypothetical protein